MTRRLAILVLTVAAAAITPAVLPGCGASFVERPIETSMSFTNLSTRFYAALQIRSHSASGAAYFKTALLPPGATQRERFLDAFGEPCPDSLDLRLFLYRRINGDVPIGLDADEAVDPAPAAAAEIPDVPACRVATVETYTIVLWDADDGVGRVKLAQDTPIDAAIRRLDLFPNADSVWEFHGVAAELAGEPLPPAAPRLPIAGRVLDTDGVGVENVGVLSRARFRVRLDDNDPANDPDVGFGEPIAVTDTDTSGHFSLSRPGGAYRVEVFADGLLFRPAFVDVETPLEEVTFLAEPTP